MLAAVTRPRAGVADGLWLATALMAVLLYFSYVHPNLDVYFGIY